MKIYNTLSKKVEEFIPYRSDKVTMYTCGPTVYHDQHIGNMRNYIGHDILEKTLRYLGYNVIRCMNITDVGHLSSDSDTGEDKMLKGAEREHKTVLEIADYYTKAFKDDFKKLNNKWPDIVSKATDNIDQYILMIEKLLKDGFAYSSGGNIYFDTSKLDNYYCLTNQDDNMVIGARDGVEEDSNKKNQADFVLWFTTSKFENHELLWDSPWGRGYPGWHIECSGISIKYLGDRLDIHGGGVDNIFPHHTNEIAQSEAYLGHKWCNYWFHNEHLLDKSGKMSKSKGDILTVSYLESKGYDPLAFRFMCLNSHYRKQLVFSFDALDQSSNTLTKLRNRISSLKNNGSFDNEKFNYYKSKFVSYLEDDLNTANSIAVLYELLKDENLNSSTKLELVKDFDKVLSLNLISTKNDVDSELEDFVLKKIEERKVAKANKDFALADAIRDELISKGIKLVDTREGTTYELI